MRTAEEVAKRVRELGVVDTDRGRVAAGAACFRAGTWRVEVGGDASTIFDLASVTKPMTALAVARSGIDRAAPLGALLPELAGTPSAPVPLELFLAHRAGLLSHVILYEPCTRGEHVDVAAALETAARSMAESPSLAEHAPLYSDMGYLLVGAALARHAGLPDPGDAVARYALGPLGGAAARIGTARQLEARGVDLLSLAAPTEVVPWRSPGGPVVGRVHDENAWAITGAGGSGHAGMFGTIDEVLAFGCAVHDAIVAEPELDWLVRERPGGTLRAGFDGKSAEGSSAGKLFGPRSFGHLGFTGTSLWIDPDAHVVVSLLTNRVYPTRENIAIRAARPEAHEALFERALSLSVGQPGANHNA